LLELFFGFSSYWLSLLNQVLLKPKMPIAPGMPTNSGMDFSSGADCLSPCASPKVNVSLSETNDPSFDSSNWSQDAGAMPQMMYAPSSDAFGCPPAPAPVFVVGMPYMMDQNGQVVQLPCPMDQSGQAVWAAPANGFHMQNHVPTNGFHMMQSGNDSWGSHTVQNMYNESSTAETNHSLEDSASGALCNDGLCMAADADWQKSSQDSFAPQSEMLTLDDDVAALGSPRKMLVDAELLAYVEEQLENSDISKRVGILIWMQPAVVDLALSAKGTRVVQKALEVTGGEPQLALSQCFHGRVRQLLDSHHGNHVLQKSIVVMPPHAIHFILHELSFFSGGWVGVVKHRFGCRVVERLLEHCKSDVTTPIVAAVVAEIDLLAKHPFANYVVQHILEYVPAHRHQVVNALIQVGVPLLAQHRVASNIVEKAFEHGDVKSQVLLAEAVLSSPYAIVEMGCSRYGSFTVRRMLEALQDPLHSMAVHQLAEAIPSLRASKHGRHIAARVQRLAAGYV